jgi:hypothetical protein
VGLAFSRGDVLHVVNKEDPNWWQVRQVTHTPRLNQWRCGTFRSTGDLSPSRFPSLALVKQFFELPLCDPMTCPSYVLPVVFDKIHVVCVCVVYMQCNVVLGQSQTSARDQKPLLDGSPCLFCS